MNKNSEGYPDPTACNAINNVEKALTEDDERFHKLLNSIFTICELAGFHIEGRTAKRVKFGGNVWNTMIFYRHYVMCGKKLRRL